MKWKMNEPGFALVAVLWALTLLSLMAVTVLSSARTEVKIASYLLEEGKAEAIADGVTNKAIYELLRPPPEREWSPGGQIQTYSFAGVDTTVRIRDELEKIDLNNADATILVSLFQSVGLGDSEAQKIADAIGDWRDADDLRRLNGAEARDYRLAGLDYKPSNARFETVQELRWVLGVSDKLYDCVEPALTVYSGRSGVSSSAENALVVDALKRALGEEDKVDDGTAPRAEPSRRAVLMSLDGRAFEILVEVPMEKSAPFRRRAVVRITGNPQDPYWIYAWERWDEKAEDRDKCQLS